MNILSTTNINKKINNTIRRINRVKEIDPPIEPINIKENRSTRTTVNRINCPSLSFVILFCITSTEIIEIDGTDIVKETTRELIVEKLKIILETRNTKAIGIPNEVNDSNRACLIFFVNRSVVTSIPIRRTIKNIDISSIETS